MALKDLYSIIGGRIKEFREVHNLTQAEVSEKTGINRATISNIESGKQQVSLNYVYLIAKALDTEILTFLPTIKELNIQTEEAQAFLTEKINEQDIDEATKNAILLSVNKKPEDDK